MHDARHQRIAVPAQRGAVDLDPERLGGLRALAGAGVGDEVGGHVVGAHAAAGGRRTATSRGRTDLDRDVAQALAAGGQVGRAPPRSWDRTASCSRPGRRGRPGRGAATMAAASASVKQSGFSQKTCSPASSAASTVAAVQRDRAPRRAARRAAPRQQLGGRREALHAVAIGDRGPHPGGRVGHTDELEAVAPGAGGWGCARPGRSCPRRPPPPVAAAQPRSPPPGKGRSRARSRS